MTLAMGSESEFFGNSFDGMYLLLSKAHFSYT